LSTGGTLVIPDLIGYDDQLISKLIAEHQITLLNCAPSAFYPLIGEADNYQRLQSLRHVFLGGEAIDMMKLNHWCQTEHCNAQIVNTYGPTECSDVVSYFRIDIPEDYRNKAVPIGRPNDNNQLFILDRTLNIVPIGIIGEICITGACVGQGYLNNPLLTDEVFIDAPFSTPENSCDKFYRTGDLARYNRDGDIEYIGRIDFQVKLRGLRIELGEIEHALEQYESIQDAITLVQNDALVAYIVSTETTVDRQSIRASMRQYLPDYMIPSVYMKLDAMPLTPNGKIDRKALPEPDYEQMMSNAYIAPSSETEKQLVEIWSEILDIEKDHLLLQIVCIAPPVQIF
jgi:acyl-coenzyme A synthetase/AMP-(fatty) acid ligase